MRGLLRQLPFVLVVGGCASNPATIEPAFMPPSTFVGRDCASLSADIAAIEPHLKEIAIAQRKRRTTDFATGIIVGVTPSMFDNKADRESEIARLKGQLAGLRKAGQEQACALPPEDPELTKLMTPPPAQDAGSVAHR